MGLFRDDSDQASAYYQVMNAPNNAELSHELIAGAAAYEAAKAYDNHCAQNGQPESDAKAKEVLAVLAGAFVDRIAESKGGEFFDKERAKHQAEEQLYDLLLA